MIMRSIPKMFPTLKNPIDSDTLCDIHTNKTCMSIRNPLKANGSTQKIHSSHMKIPSQRRCREEQHKVLCPQKKLSCTKNIQACKPQKYLPFSAFLAAAQRQYGKARNLVLVLHCYVVVQKLLIHMEYHIKPWWLYWFCRMRIRKNTRKPFPR